MKVILSLVALILIVLIVFSNPQIASSEETEEGGEAESKCPWTTEFDKHKTNSKGTGATQTEAEDNAIDNCNVKRDAMLAKFPNQQAYFDFEKDMEESCEKKDGEDTGCLFVVSESQWDASECKVISNSCKPASSGFECKASDGGYFYVFSCNDSEAENVN
jgi:hypothetical protein